MNEKIKFVKDNNAYELILFPKMQNPMIVDGYFNTNKVLKDNVERYMANIIHNFFS